MKLNINKELTSPLSFNDHPSNNRTEISLGELV